MILGQPRIQLLVLVGDNIPLPAPYAAMQALTRVTVDTDEGGEDGFQMSFSLGKNAVQDYGLLMNNTFGLAKRVIVAVLLNSLPQVLIDGIITNHQVSPSGQPGQSTLTVTGKGLTTAMDYEEEDGRYSCMPDFVIVMQLLAKYARFGLLPQVTPTADVPLPILRTPQRSRRTDLGYIRDLAEKNGFIFFIEPVTLGINRAYWGPKIRVGLPQPGLAINLGSASNLSRISFNQDALVDASVQASFVEPISKVTIPLPAIPPLALPPLALRPTPSPRKTLLGDVANKDPLQALLAISSAVFNQPDSVTGSGELDTQRYGAVLRPRRLVGLRGAGLSYDGFYRVRRVSHTLTADPKGDYTQSFELGREGTLSLTPVVLP